MENSINKRTLDHAVLKVRLVRVAVILGGQAQEAEIHTLMTLHNLCVSLVQVCNRCPRRFQFIANMAALQLHINRGRMVRHLAVISVQPLLFAGNIQRFLLGVGEGRYGLISVTCSAFNDRTAHGVIAQDHGTAATTGDRCVRQLGTILRRFFLNGEACANGDLVNGKLLANFHRILSYNGLVFQRMAANVGEADPKPVLRTG